MEAELEQESRAQEDTLLPSLPIRSHFPEDFMLAEPWPQVGSERFFNTRPLMLYINAAEYSGDSVIMID